MLRAEPRKEVLSDSVELWLGDCRDVLPLSGRIDAVVTDPPYGIGFDWESRRARDRRSGLDWGRSGLADRDPSWTDIIGDGEPFDPSPWLQFSQVILWGGNNYVLPPSRGWLIWDKRRDTTPDHHGDAEIAWTNLDQVIRVHRQVWRGIVREGEENVANGPKLHPTQKPLALMTWCVGMTEGDILDPFMGSGTTGVTCVNLGRKFIGIEIEPKYYDIARRRISEALAQPRLPFEELPQIKQESML